MNPQHVLLNNCTKEEHQKAKSLGISGGRIKILIGPVDGKVCIAKESEPPETKNNMWINEKAIGDASSKVDDIITISEKP